MSRIVPSSPEASRRMAKIRQKGTDAEVALRRELYQIGLRYRIDFEVLKKPRRVADIAFPGRKIAIFVDGCFWHGCPEHASWPKRNAEFWRQKIETNQLRDVDTNERLRSLGWTVLRFWSHESPIDAAAVVADMVTMIDSNRHAASHDIKGKNWKR
ncbi:very short patch repair endonuclease [Burkholderia pseudomallei]|uniref:very short patch repair endonuclease n=1 Tax=Burkholderia pseudomallei TaxID=28450 RepID=UPI000DD02AD0|nr:very short patch repair endonuclease [Burkholderia pseudomallei]